MQTKFGVNVVPQVEAKSLQVTQKKLKPSGMESAKTLALNASATGSGRTKVALKPGHSLMDWIRYTHCGKDLTTTGGKVLEVSPRELAKHNSKNDAWIALKGKVYNITPYLDYHPGGEEELMRGAGKDATDLFNQVHRWVNAESMLQKCFVGVLKKSWSFENIKVSRFSPGKPVRKSKNPKLSPESNLAPPGPVRHSDRVYESTFSSSSAVIDDISASLFSENNKIRVIGKRIKYKELITDLNEGNLFIKINQDTNMWLMIKFPCIISSNYTVTVPRILGSKYVDLIFEQNGDSCFNFSKIEWTLSTRDDKSIFWPCKLLKKIPVNYNTHLFTFSLPLNVKMWIPIGCHVFVKSDIEGMEIVRSYTPVVSSLLSSKQNDLFDGSQITLMIKIYPSGTLTPILNMCDIGESVFISSYAGSFSENTLIQSESIVMLAAGTGITPMIRVISWALTADDRKRSLLLLFFNKTEDDILWNGEFENCCKINENFQIINILSEPSHKWNGYTGSICDNVLRQFLPERSVFSQLILICGPIPFTDSAVRILEKLHYNKEHIHAFTG